VNETEETWSRRKGKEAEAQGLSNGDGDGDGNDDAIKISVGNFGQVRAKVAKGRILDAANKLNFANGQGKNENKAQRVSPSFVCFQW
jgi:hypothetical protein